MSITGFLAELQKLDIRLWLEAGRLRYNAPEGVLTEELRTEILVHRQEIIDFLNTIQKNQTDREHSIKPASRSGKLPLSYAQKWLWLYSQRESGSFAYNIPAALRLKGRLNISALKASINEIIQRHEVLRTTIKTEDNELYQFIAQEIKIDLPVMDLGSLPESEREAKVNEYLNTETRIPFNLEQGPLIRAALLVLNEDEYALLLILHHIVSDNWSLNVFMGELAELYKVFSIGEPSRLPALELQYADYAVWQQTSVKSKSMEASLDYWKERLKAIETIPAFPTDYTRPDIQSHDSLRQFMILPEDLTRKLKELSRREGCTLYNTILAAFHVLLHQYTGLRDVIVGTPVAGRTRRELEGLIGVFINTVVIWNTLDDRMTFLELMQDVRKTTGEAFAHQEVPLEMIMEEVQLRRGEGEGRNPLFQVLFNMFSASFELELPGLKITPFSLDVVGAQNLNSKFDIALLVIEHQAGLQVDFAFNAGVFSESTAVWFLEHFNRLLEAIAIEPDCPISDLPELRSKPYSKVGPDNPFIRFEREEIEQTLTRRFEKQVLQCPDHIALQSDRRTLTYSELNKLANRTGRLIIENYDRGLGLSRQEKIRYTRQIMLDGWGLEAQEKLKRVTVFAAGAGGSGSPTIMQLALLGVGTIIICDFDEVELSNLNRQVLHDESRIGMNKAESAAMTVKRINPNVHVIVRTEKITRNNIAELADNSAIIFDNLDDIEAKFVLSEYAVAKGIPHVISSMIEMSSYSAILHTPYTPCFHCLYDHNKLAAVRELRSEKSGWNKVPNPVASPALFLSTGFACNEALKIILGHENVAYNKYFFFNQTASEQLALTQGYKIVTYPFSNHFKELCKKQGFDWEQGFSGRFVEEITIEKDPSCPMCGSRSKIAADTAQTPEGLSSEKANKSHLEYVQAVAPKQQAVALIMEHDLEMVIGILGVLKSGNIFVTMDPAYPEDRLTYILEDTGARMILTDDANQAIAERIRDKVSRNIAVLNINELHDIPNTDNLQEHAQPESLAYIMYTSGSMGHPKGVTQKHRNVLHYIMNYTNGTHISPEDRLSLIPSFSFSAAMMDTFASLLNGATLCLYDIRRKGPAELGRWLIDEAISVYHSVPTVFRHCMASVTPDMTFSGLRLIDFGGEPVSGADVELFKKYCSDSCILVNGLGATELNVIRQYYINKQTELKGNLVPVGYPVADTEIILIDEQGRKVRYNQPGEIVIKSEFLSPGYWGMEEQTGKVFKPDPEGSSKRLYYTGDLGRLRTDGCLEHLGRKDLQLKIRGIRIEPTEIETILMEIPSIREAAVVSEENTQGNKQLVAYLVEREQHRINLDEVIAYLRDRLPSYMVPSAFIKLAVFPLTLTGKVDRRKLSLQGAELNKAGSGSTARTGQVSEGLEDIQAGSNIAAGTAKQNNFERLETGSNYASPRNKTEELLCVIWKNVLKLEQVSIHDDFFQIGGDSLSGLRMIDLAHQQGLELNPTQLSQSRTIAKLAQSIDSTSTQTAERSTDAGKGDIPGPRRAVPITSCQVWYLSTVPYLISRPRFNIVRLLEIDYPLNPLLLRQAVAYAIDCHEVLRARFVTEEGVWRQYIDNFQEEIPFEAFDFSSIPEAEQKAVIEETVERLHSSLDIAHGPLLRVAHFRLGDKKPDRLFIVLHHLGGDNFSFVILMRDIQTAYFQLAQTGKVSLTKEITPYAVFADALNAYCRSPQLESEVDYWMNLPWKQVARLTTDFPYSIEKNTEGSTARCTTTLSEAETEKLLHRIPRFYQTTLENILTITFVEAIGQWLDEDWIYLEGADMGRSTKPFTEGMDLSHTMGWISCACSLVLKRSDKNESSIYNKVRFVDEQISRVPNKGVGYAFLARLGDESNESVKKLQLEFQDRQLFFNYVGLVENEPSGIRIAKENPGWRCHPNETRCFFMECTCLIKEGKLHFMVDYSINLHTRSTIELICDNYTSYLKKIIEHAETKETNI